MEGFRGDGGHTDPGLGICPADSIQDFGQFPAAAAHKGRVRSRKAVQGLGGLSLCQVELPGPEFFPVGPDQGAGGAVPFHRPHRSGLEGQLHTDAPCPGAHVPAQVLRTHRQLGQDDRPYLLLGHGDLAPHKLPVRDARRPPGEDRGGLTEQDVEGGKGPFRTLGGGHLRDHFPRKAQIFPHCDRQPAQAGLYQFLAQSRRTARPPGEEKGSLSPAHRRHRVAGGPVGGAQGPVLPGPAQPGRQHLRAGQARDHLRLNSPLL